MPTSLTLTISPTLRTQDIEQTSLFLRGTDPLNPSDFVFSNQTIRLVCASQGYGCPSSNDRGREGALSGERRRLLWIHFLFDAALTAE
jgi:hypothetical protein